MNKKQSQAQPDKLSDQLEQLWDDLLSRQPARIRSAFESLQAAQQKAVLAHLRRMLKEDGWQPEQRSIGQGGDKSNRYAFKTGLIMDITQLTQAMHEFVRTMGWYEADSPRPQTLRNLAVSLNLEASEVLEQFQWGDNLKDTPSLSDELADVMLYLLQLASLAGIDLEKAVLAKLEKNYHRTWDAKD